MQPRTVFDPIKTQELAASIEANGIIQPLIVRRKAERYELVAGERRLRAAQAAGLSEVPAIVQDYADDRLLEIALVENLQREDLNAIETAQALDRLAREMHLSHEEIGRRTGKDRATVSNFLRLLRLPSELQLLVAEHRLSMGHARALLGLATADKQKELGERAAAQGFSVRQVERLVQQAAVHREPELTAPVPPKAISTTDPNVESAVRSLEGHLGTRVRIVPKTDQRGRIEIEYYSQDDLNRLYELLMGTVRQ
jgi:ParB family chromosome partitioning protein